MYLSHELSRSPLPPLVDSRNQRGRGNLYRSQFLLKVRVLWVLNKKKEKKEKKMRKGEEIIVRGDARRSPADRGAAPDCCRIVCTASSHKRGRGGSGEHCRPACIVLE